MHCEHAPVDGDQAAEAAHGERHDVQVHQQSVEPVVERALQNTNKQRNIQVEASGKVYMYMYFKTYS